MKEFAASDIQDGFQVGDWEVDPKRDRIRSHEGSFTLRPKVMDMLVVLARHPTEVLTVEELLTAVWPDTVTSSASVYNCLKELRAVLQDDPKAPRYIETIPRRGYRLIAPVRVRGAERKPARNRDPAFRPSANHDAVTPLASWKRSTGPMLPLALVLIAVALTITIMLKPDWETSPDSAVQFVAVLPLVDVSEDGSLEYLVDGLARSIIDDLSQNPELRLIAYESSSRFQDSAAGTQAIARQLGADLLITGTIDRRAGQIEVTIHTTHPESGETAWSSSISFPEQQAYLARSRLGEAVVSAMGGDTDPGPTETSPPRPLDTNAYALYLQAHRLIGNETKASLIEALGLLEQVREVEPDFGRAQTLQLDARSRLYLAFSESWPAGRTQDLQADLEYRQELLREAERLADEYPTLAESHLLLGRMSRTLRQFEKARSALERALEINPSLGEAHRELGWLNHNMYGSLARTADHFRRAVALDPYSGELRAVLVTGLAQIASGHEELWRVLSDTKQRLPWSPRISLAESIAMLSEGRYSDSIRVLEDALNRSDDPRVRDSLASNWHSLDRTDRSRQLLPGFQSWRDNTDPKSLDPANRCPSRADQVDRELHLWAAYVCAYRRRPQQVREILELMIPRPLDIGFDPNPMLGTEFSAAILMAWALQGTGDAGSAKPYLVAEEQAIDSRTEHGALESSGYFKAASRLAAARGETRKMFSNLAKMLESGLLNPVAMAHPVYDDYRSMPEFQALLERRSELVRVQLDQLGLAAGYQFAGEEPRSTAIPSVAEPQNEP